MEATYCIGSDMDVCRMFDQYLYKVSPVNYIRHLSIVRYLLPLSGIFRIKVEIYVL